MKKLLFAISILSASLLTACNENDGDKGMITGQPSERFIGVKGEVKIVTDIETGCKYIYVKEGSGQYATMSISPLIKEDKTFDCK